MNDSNSLTALAVSPARSPKFKDETGKKYGRLSVLSLFGLTANGMTLWNCRCDCGKAWVTRGSALRSGLTKSCGCLAAEITSKRTTERLTTHGLAGQKVYWAWAAMIQRCSNPNHPSFKDYGERGIKVCERWANSFEAFFADMGHPPKGMSLERIENDGIYCKANCKWASRKEQQNNRRTNRRLTLNGVTLTMTQWAERTGIKFGTIKARLSYGYSTEEALTP